MQTREERGRELMAAMLAERERQIAKFGAQLNVPCIPNPNLSWMSEADAKRLCDEAFAKGEGSWAHIALEEFCESVEAPNDAARRVELVQLLTVVMAWIEAIDARSGRFEDPDAEPRPDVLGVSSYVRFAAHGGSVGKVLSANNYGGFYVEWVYGRDKKGEVVKALQSVAARDLIVTTKDVYVHMRDREFNSGSSTMPPEVFTSSGPGEVT